MEDTDRSPFDKFKSELKLKCKNTKNFCKSILEELEKEFKMKRKKLSGRISENVLNSSFAAEN